MGHGITKNILLDFISTPASGQLELAALGGSWFHAAGHREHIQQGGKACALIWLAAGPRTGWAEAQLLPGMEAWQTSQKRKLEALQLH